MKKILFLCFPLFLLASGMRTESELVSCYNSGKGDDSCGKELAYLLKKEKNDLAAEIFLDLSLKGDVDATRELGLYYIDPYTDKSVKDCQKGVIILLNAADGRVNKKQSALAYKELANLFKDGICLEKSEEKYKKYNDLYLEKAKEELRQKQVEQIETPETNESIENTTTIKN